MSAMPSQRLWYGICGLCVGAFVVIHWPSFGPRDVTPYLIDTQSPVTAADAVLLGHGLNLNCADATALEILTGIGPALASRIADDRAQRGPFARVEDITRVHGIGPSLLAQMQPFVRVGPCSDNS